MRMTSGILAAAIAMTAGRAAVALAPDAGVTYTVTARVFILERAAAPAGPPAGTPLVVVLGTPKSVPRDDIRPVLERLFGAPASGGDALPDAKVTRLSQGNPERWAAVVHDVIAGDATYEVRLKPLRANPLHLRIDVARSAVVQQAGSGRAGAMKVVPDADTAGDALSTEVIVDRGGPILIVVTQGRQMRVVAYWWSLTVAAVV